MDTTTMATTTVYTTTIPTSTTISILSGTSNTTAIISTTTICNTKPSNNLVAKLYNDVTAYYATASNAASNAATPTNAATASNASNNAAPPPDVTMPGNYPALAFHAAPLDVTVGDKIRQQIISNVYIDFATLLGNESSEGSTSASLSYNSGRRHSRCTPPYMHSNILKNGHT